eukprot:TRINITY_DN7561_c1_g1_i1.p1 TRINITY_DN7561_c1_g1~~TRINITY_DN7561_c1_g1_i1.p1  ORF type:complete len:262 (+),score=72.01 TRINITY_DN7561_c1_g1_i1:57-788(+)
MPAPLPPDSFRCIALTTFDVSVPTQPSRLEQVAVFYSMLPWIGAALWILAAASTRRASLIAPVLWVLLMLLLSEGIIKKLFPMSRPQLSCLHSNGMPSSHSAIAVGMLVWSVLTARFNYSGQHIPLRKALGFVALFLAFGPVPASRVLLHDHTVLQVVVGGLLGAVCAATVAVLTERNSGALRELLRSLPHVHDDSYDETCNEPGFVCLRTSSGVAQPARRVVVDGAAGGEELGERTERTKLI